ncbi:hypothetical protein ES703_43929 [subsurface metagenome]
MKKALLIPIVLTLITTLLLPSCSSGVLPEQYAKVSADLATAQTEIKDLQAGIKALQEELSAKEKSAPEISGADLATAQAEIKDLQALIKALQEELSAKEKSALEISDDAPQSITPLTRSGRSIDDFWLGSIEAPGIGITKVRPSDYWTEAGIRIPTESRHLWLETRRIFKYPEFEFISKLPPMAEGEPYPFLQIGFITGRDALSWSVFNLRGNDCWLRFGSFPIDSWCRVTTIMPADYSTAEHRYRIKVNKCSTEFFIDNALKAVGLYNVPEAIPQWSHSPYALESNFAPPSIALPVTICWDYGGIEATAPIPVDSIYSAADGDPLPPRQYPLYTNDSKTKWNGLSTGDVITSHPVPVWGYERKTLFFQSDATGTLTIQIYTGGEWRDLISITLEADTLLVYNLNAEAPIARCVYTPVGTDTIAAAEFHLAGSR